MKAALTVWNGRISPVFDVSREAVILTIKKGIVVVSSTENIEVATAALKIDRLTGLGVETLICGAISESLHWELTARGVKVFGFVAGEIDEVVQALIAGTLPASALSMPGCYGRQTASAGCEARAADDVEAGVLTDAAEQNDKMQIEEKEER